MSTPNQKKWEQDLWEKFDNGHLFTVTNEENTRYRYLLKNVIVDVEDFIRTQRHQAVQEFVERLLGKLEENRHLGTPDPWTDERYENDTLDKIVTIVKERSPRI